MSSDYGKPGANIPPRLCGKKLRIYLRENYNVRECNGHSSNF